MKLSKIYRNNKLLIILVSLLVILIGLPIILFVMVKRNVTTAAWFNSEWTNRKTITVGNTSGGTLTNEDVLVVVDTAALITAGKLQTDCDDLRFVDSDDTTQISYWIEGGCNTSTTQIWVRVPSLPNGGKTIYMYYNHSTATNAEVNWTGSFTLLSDVACPSGWTRKTDLDNRFPLGATTSGTTGGSSSHGHGTFSQTSGGALQGRGCGNEGCGNTSLNPISHTHLFSATVDTNSSVLPPYKDAIFCSNSDLDINSGLIAMFSTSEPSGWTYFDVFFGLMPRGASTYGASGGSTTHTHTLSNFSSGTNSAAGTFPYANCDTTPSRNASRYDHQHTLLSGNTSAANHVPPYLDVLFAKADSNTTGTEDMIVMTSDNPPLGWSNYTAMNNRFPRGSNSPGGTGGSSTHTHTVTINAAAEDFGDNNPESGGSNVAHEVHGHTASGTSSSASNFPPYITVIYSQRNSSQSTSVGSEESQAPTIPTIQPATPSSTTSITWNFTDNSDNETGFKVYNTSDILMVTCAFPNISSCLEASLSENTQYTRKVTAYNAVDESDFSSTTNAYTLISTPSIESTTTTVDSVSIKASTIANITAGSSGYYFDCTDTGCDTGINSWITTDTDISTGLANNTGYTYQVKARNGDSVETPNSPTQEAWTKASTPSISILDSTDTTVTLGVTGVNNPSQGNSGIYFECVSGSCTGGIDEWVTTDSDTSISLTPNTQYTFKAKARNYDSVETTYSSEISTYTQATQPEISTITNVSENGMTVIINPYGNPSTTLYMVEEVNTAKYITAGGVLDVTPVWLTYDQLGNTSGIPVTGLMSNTEYTYRVKAKNEDDVETPYSSLISQYTNLLAPTSITPDTKTDSSITWKLATTETGYDGIKIYDADNTLITTCIVANGTECLENNLVPNTEYSRKLTIYNTHSESTYSNTLLVRTYSQDVSITSSSTINDYEVSLTLDFGDNPGGTNIGIFDENTSKYYDDTLGILVDGETQFVPATDTVVISGLSPNTLYTFKARSIDDDSNPSSWSSTEDVRTYAQVPNIVTTTAISTTSGSITVDMVSNPVGTRVSISETTTGRYLSSTTNTLEVTEDVFVMVGDTITVNGLLANETYTFRVKAYSEEDIGTEWSSTLNLTTLIEQPIVTVEGSTEDSITLSISGVSNITSGDSGIYVEDIAIWSQNLTQTVTELVPNTDYTFNVKARNSNGVETIYVISGSKYTLAQSPTISLTSPLTTSSGLLTLDIGDNPVGTKVSIIETNSNKFLSSSTNTLVDEEDVFVILDNPISVSGLSPNTTYMFKIRAYNEDDEVTTFSEEVSLTTLIQDPTISISDIASSSVVISVSGISNITEGDSGINIEQVGATWSQNLDQTIINLTPNSTYTFNVRTRNGGAVENEYVTSDSITTLASVPVVSSVTKESSTSARIYIGLNGNPTTTQIAIRDRVSEMYVSGSGTLQSNAVWQTYDQWGGSNGQGITGIDTVRQLGFEAKARNMNNIETTFSEAEYIGTGSIILNSPEEISLILKDDVGVDVTSTAMLGVQDISIKQNEYLVADLSVSFAQDRDWSDIVIEADVDDSKTVVKVKEDHGITEPFTMYVVMRDTNAFRICPQASTLDEVNSECIEGILVSDTFPQEVDIDGLEVTISQAKIDGVYYWIADGLVGTGGMGENVEEGSEVVDNEEEEEELVIINFTKEVVQKTVEMATKAILGTKEVLDSTIIGTLNEEGLTNVVNTTTTVTITVGVATTGLSQTFYLLIHFVNGIFNAFGFRRKRKPFGYVYDSKSKEPVSNAVVRIFKGKELLETTVTDSSGVFVSKLEKGEYVIEVKKGGYEFPTSLVKGSEDYPLKNIYKGGVFKKLDNLDVVISIPIDQKKLTTWSKVIIFLRSILSVVFSILNILLFAFGILMITYTYYKYPELFNWYVLLLYIPALYFLTKSLFNRRTKYGKLVDNNGSPIINTQVDLVEKEFEEVVDKRVTDSRGRFRFVCEKGEYSLRVGKDVLVESIVIKRNGKIFAKRVVRK